MDLQARRYSAADAGALAHYVIRILGVSTAGDGRSVMLNLRMN